MALRRSSGAAGVAVMAETRSPQPNLQSEALRFSKEFWLVIVLTGIAAGIVGGLLMRLLRLVEALAWPPYRTHPDFLFAVEQVPAHRRLFFLAIAALLAGTVRRLLSRHPVRGHGGDVVESIWLGSARIPPLRTFANSVLSIVVVGLGASLGREGGIKHAGAAFASIFSVWTKIPESQRRLAVACGAGAGMAAAYNVPFGGALFAMEVLLGSLALPTVIPALLASLIATACAWLLLPNQIVYPVSIAHLSGQELIWSLAAGPVLGFAAAWFIRAIAWADRQTHRGWRAFVMPTAVLLTLGLLSMPMPWILGNGKDVIRAAYENRFPLSLLFVLPFMRCLATTGCLAGGIPGGLFTPTMTCGATLGALLGRVLAPLGINLDVSSCAIVGSGAFLAAATEGPVSSIVLLLELTRQVQPIIVPILLCVAGATLTTRALETRSIYSARIKVHPGGTVTSSDPNARGDQAPQQRQR